MSCTTIKPRPPMIIKKEIVNETKGSPAKAVMLLLPSTKPSTSNPALQ